MTAIVRLEIEIQGKRYIRRVQLLGATDEGMGEATLLYYRFPLELRAIVRKSQVFARLKKDVMFALSSKYSLALYELCEKRVNMGRRWSEDFSVERLRQLLGVDPDKLTAFKSLNQRTIQPAVAEVNFLSDFGCSVEPVMSGRKVVKVRLSWWKKISTRSKLPIGSSRRPRSADAPVSEARSKGSFRMKGSFPPPGQDPGDKYLERFNL